ncbi:hypothetical protein A2W14_03580 [Candidatus Gottesmanbacteria bacterium RBG_16_37_8]|uniref:ArnT-like N-terminal domain-containing protein n=1 Tax=Candidatus Gottesmanbacteria bacterium RBG_16_37_8 TaxID=1798371 RepID=A0A1F5YSS0_9BACT|nr:MAG: hypothetical protein A2W14_03580 [Candidatus Gottesmanbacteria bacterium RBG_16_37_8]
MKKHIILILILLIAAFLRFFNSLHDSPYFFNPDERNMAIAISRFVLPSKLTAIPSCLASEFFPKNLDSNDCSLNPHFFSYGQFPLYLAFTSDQITKPVINLINPQPAPKNMQLTTDFPSAVYWLRFYSALFSVLIVLAVFLISRQLFSFNLSLILAAFSAFTPGLIQAAHFGTTESLLTFFFLSAVFFSLKLQSSLSLDKKLFSNKLILYSFFISISVGLALGAKLTGVFFLIPPFLILLFELFKSASQKKKNWPVFIIGLTVPAKKLFQLFSIGLFILIISLIIFVIFSPYNLVEPANFTSAVFGYESDVATGKFEAFYTRQFVNTLPFIFHMEKIFPFALGWPLYLLGIIGFLLLNLKLTIKFFLVLLKRMKIIKLHSKNPLLLITVFEEKSLLIIFSFLIFLLPNTILFAKWTRFMTPIFPFFAIFSGYFINYFERKFSKKVFLLLSSSFLILALSPGFAFMSIYKNKDSRVTASYWIYQNLSNNSYVLSETANVVDIPLGLTDYRRPDFNATVISFDFYHLDEKPELYAGLLDHLEKADYIFIPSRRIFKNHLQQPEKYKLVTKYFQLLFSGRLGFVKVTEFSSYPSLRLGPINLQFPDEDAEETFTVFDHPVIRIYKKVTPMSKNDYHLLFIN